MSSGADPAAGSGTGPGTGSGIAGSGIAGSGRRAAATAPSAPGPVAGAGSVRRADDVLAMQRLAARRGPTRALLGWLADRTGFWVALVDRSGAVLRRPPGRSGGDPVDLVTSGIARAVAGRSRSVVLDGCVDGEARTAYLVGVGGPDPAPLLAAVGRRPDGGPPGGLPALLADAARTLGLCWQVEEARHTRRRSEAADARSREAVLHLLMTGELPTAYRIAAALRPPLPDESRFYVVECAPGRRDEIAERCSQAAGGRAWIVPCPVRFDHLLALVPLEGARTGSLDETITAAVEDCRVGVSGVIALRDTAVGYEQAFHALAVARNGPVRRARFSPLAEPAPLLDERGPVWAEGVLSPLLSHEPRRRTDPGAEELAATLNSWLYFGTPGAAAHLKVHRNTLAARLRLVRDLLGRDLDRVGEQAALSLSLRVRGLRPRYARPSGARPDQGGPTGAEGPPVSLDGLLATPELRRWAGLRLRPLDEAGPPSALETVRVWLDHDTRLGPTAAALGISVPGARKRLTRIENVLERSLLQAPSAKYDLWLALKARGTGSAGPADPGRAH